MKVKKAKPKVRRSLGGEIKTTKEPNKIYFSDYFNAWKSRGLFTSLKTEDKDAEFNPASYDVAVENLRKKNALEVFDNDKVLNSINKINQEGLFKLLVDLIQLESNILLYGIGSKLRLIYDFLNVFQNEVNIYRDSTEGNYYHIMVLNGFNPDIRFSNLLENIQNYIISFTDDAKKQIKMTLDNSKTAESSIYKLGELKKEMKITQKFLLVINNIDGPSFLGKSVQKLLSKLVNHVGIQVLATCDNLYYTYYWNQQTKDNFSFYFVKYNTFAEYLSEISESLSLTGERKFKSGIGFSQIFKSLTIVQRKMIKAIAECQIGETTIQLTLKILTEILMDKMIVNSLNQVKEMLIEPMDHSLIVEKAIKNGKTVYKLNLNDQVVSDIASGAFDSL